jgi:uncharacterized protein
MADNGQASAAVAALQALQTLVANGALMDRAALAGRLGMTFEGSRDLYAAAGYDRTLTFDQLWARYKRHGLARRIVQAAPDETWIKPPRILDGADLLSAVEDSPFVQAWGLVAGGSQAWEEITDGTVAQRGLLHYLHRVDTLSGVGEYAVLVLGIRDGAEGLDQPLVKNGAKGPQDLLYASVYAQGAAPVLSLEMDTTSPRYGLPLTYNVQVATLTGSQSQVVHWTRVVHVADSVDDSEVYGTPRLAAPWNDLINSEKIPAAGAEAAYQLSNPGYVMTTAGDKRFPTSPEALQDLEDQMDEFVHGLRRWLMAEGLEPKQLGGSVTDPSGLMGIVLDLISAATRIPKRILLGSERGELASTQDERNWARQIETRRANHVVPSILKTVIHRLLYAGVLPPPSAGTYVVDWEPLLEPDRTEAAEIAAKVADALSKLGIAVDPAEFVKAYLTDLPPDAVEAAPPPPAPTIQPAQPGQEVGALAQNATAPRFRWEWRVAPEEDGSAPAGGWAAYP